MAGTYANGVYVNPTQYKKSSLWDQPWAQKAYNANPYGQFNQRVGGYGASMLSGPDPTAGGIGGFKDSLDLGGYPDIGDSRTVSTLGKWQGYLEGGARRLMDKNARTVSNLSAATSRFGPAGGSQASSQGQAGVNEALASMFGNNVAQAMGYMKDKAGYDLSAAGSYLDYLKAKMGAGVNLLGLEKSGIDSATGYDKAMFDSRAGDYRADVDADQQWVTQLPQLIEQEAARQRASQDRGTASNQAMSLDSLLRSITTDLNYNTGANANPFMLGNTAYLRYKGALSPTKYGYA